METILADTSVSITELKRNPSAVIEAADDEAVAVLVHNNLPPIWCRRTPGSA